MGVVLGMFGSCFGACMLAGIDLVKSSRLISLVYRNTVITDVHVESFDEELNLRFAALLKSVACTQELLAPLSCEAMMGIEDAGDLPVECPPLEEVLVKQVVGEKGCVVSCECVCVCV